MHRAISTCLLALLVAAVGLHLRAEEEMSARSTGLPNVKLPTLGGKQFWADVHFFHDWRIQREVVTGHHRLLSPNNVRLAWGSLDACLAKLAEIRQQQGLPPMSGKAVVVLHGLGRSRSAMGRLAATLREDGGYHVFNVGYPTLMGSIGEHAKTLDSVVRSLEGVEEINFVCHSLGNLVVRRWLHDSREPETGEPRENGRLGRMVMLGPPNQRPELAGKVARVSLATTIGGKAFRELAEGWEEIAPTLLTPPMPFGIIAGGRGDDGGYNPLVPGDDDMIVSVTSTKLVGASDFVVLPVLHTFMMNDTKVQKYVLQFLKDGYFTAKDAAAPIDATGEP
jgi:hypothetical protein